MAKDAVSREMIDKKVEEASELFKALAHPLRIKLICGLIKEPCTQAQIGRTLNIPVSSLAQHLTVLKRIGIVFAKRDKGPEQILYVVDERVPQIFEVVCRGQNIQEYISWCNM